VRRLKKEFWPCRVVLSTDRIIDDVTDISLWLQARVGEFERDWHRVEGFNNTDYYFRNQADATIFALKWSQ
jgi:hypothetical protein